ncbi:hypothetical protein ACXZ66_11140 [Corynebacterium sp. S7]
MGIRNETAAALAEYISMFSTSPTDPKDLANYVLTAVDSCMEQRPVEEHPIRYALTDRAHEALADV